MCLPSYLDDETDCHTGILVCATESINNIQLLVRKLLDCQLFYGFPCFLSSRMVVILVLIRSPPYSVLRVLIHNDEFVFWGTTGVDTCHNVHCTKLADLSFLITCQFRSCLFLKEYLIRRVVNNLSSSGNAILA